MSSSVVLASLAPRARSVLDFWFTAPASSSAPESSPSPPVRPTFRREWFVTSEDFDAQIRTQFADDIEAANRGDYDSWAADPHGRLALIILLDQFPRNIFRRSARAFSYDSRALHFCRQGLGLPALTESADDATTAATVAAATAVLPPIFETLVESAERMFYLLPLEHAESRECAALSEALYSAFCPGGLAYARSHRAIIDRFGRYPYRNAVLGRANTPEEEEFLNDPNTNRFGQ